MNGFESEDEEEVLQNFEEEARLIIQTETLPKKSSERYLLVYRTYKEWKNKNINLLSPSEESNLIVYFKQLQKKLKPSTLWSIWSMLKSTLNSKDNINIKEYLNLKTLIKNNSKGYVPRKSLAFRWDQLIKFMNDAPDYIYLAAKVILIFGICGALRCDEITNMKVSDVEEIPNDKFLVTVHDNKNNYPGQFIIGKLFHQKVKDYISRRPDDQNFSDRFFIQYSKNKCTRQPMGRHKIGEVPKTIATYLNLEDANRFTGHCFRRSSATLLSESGATMQQIKQLGRWRSDIIAQGYIEHSIRNKELIYNGIVHESNGLNVQHIPFTELNVQPILSNALNVQHIPFTELNVQPTVSNALNLQPIPSTSALVYNNHDNTYDANIISDLNLADIDFSDDFTTNNKNESPTVKFVTANVNQNKSVMPQHASNILRQPQPVPSTSKTSVSNIDSKVQARNTLFSKPAVKLTFNNAPSTVQPPLPKKRKVSDDTESANHRDENFNNISSNLSKYDVKFENCTYNSCVFNITNCDCKSKDK